MADESIILLVEDSEDDALLVGKSLSKGYISNPLQWVKSGDEAIEYLSGEGKFANREEFPIPSLVLLDLKLPGTDGFDVLRWIRSHPSLCALRVVVLTSSNELRDVNRAYQLGANSFLVKPLEFHNFRGLARTLREHWLNDSRAPTAERPPKGRTPAAGKRTPHTPI